MKTKHCKTRGFAASLKAVRAETGATQHESAAFLGLGWRTLAGWEIGENEPAPYAQPLILEKLATLRIDKAAKKKTAKKKAAKKKTS